METCRLKIQVVMRRPCGKIYRSLKLYAKLCLVWRPRVRTCTVLVSCSTTLAFDAHLSKGSLCDLEDISYLVGIENSWCIIQLGCLRSLSAFRQYVVLLIIVRSTADWESGV
jgi:hypothetical protein